MALALSHVLAGLFVVRVVREAAVVAYGRLIPSVLFFVPSIFWRCVCSMAALLSEADAHYFSKACDSMRAESASSVSPELECRDVATPVRLVEEPFAFRDELLVTQLTTQCVVESSGRYDVAPNYIFTVQEGSGMAPRWRTQLVEWMREVTGEFSLCDATFFAAVQLLDRLLSRRRVCAKKLQAVALACLVICSKVHDTKPLRMVRAIFFFGVSCLVRVAQAGRRRCTRAARTPTNAWH
jgi:hypothetical protein